MLVRPFSSVFKGSYVSVVKVRRSKTLPWPPVIFAIISFPQRTTQVTPPINTRTIKRASTERTFRTFPVFFFSFFIFLASFFSAFFWDFLEALRSLSPSLKSKAWTGSRKFSLDADSAVVGVSGSVKGLIVVSVTNSSTLIVFLVGFLGACFLTITVFLVGLVVVFFERRETSPSIDLFFSIAYNYNMKAYKLTKKQLAVLNFLEDFTEENGYSPSYREIMTGLGLSSVSAVAEHIENLVSKGVLKKVPGAARSLEVLDYKHEETVGLFKAKMLDCSEEERKVLVQAGEILGLDLE